MSELALDPRRTAVVVIDIQKGIVALPGAPHTTSSVIANCTRLLGAARSAGAHPVLVHVGGSPADSRPVSSLSTSRINSSLGMERALCIQGAQSNC